MAKKSVVARNEKRKRLVEKYAQKRQALRAVINNKTLSREERLRARMALQRLPRDSSPCRVRRRCAISHRPRGVYRLFGLSRQELLRLAKLGVIPGLEKASW